MTVPIEPGRGVDAAALAELNDLLAIDRDAVEAYTIAIGALANVGRRETVIRFRADHERHIESLTRAVRTLGGTPAERSRAAGPFKLAMQGLASGAGDRAIMEAFEANEAQLCEKYTRAVTHAAHWPPDIAEMVTDGVDDEVRHYEWAADQLTTLGASPASAATRVARAAERAQARLADGAETVERHGRSGVDAVRRRAAALRQRLPASLPDRPSNRVLAVGAIAAGVGFLLTAAIGASLRRRR